MSSEEPVKMDESMPCFERDLSIKYSNQFGRYIQTNEELPAGTNICTLLPFASGVINYTGHPYCLICLRQDAKFIACKHCSDVFFCSLKCKQANQTHILECGTSFHRIDDVHVKCAIQIVLEAITIFGSVERLRRYVNRHFLNSKASYTIPQACDGKKSKFDIVMSLTSGKQYSELPFADAKLAKAYLEILKLESIASLFNTVKLQAFLHRFLRHNLAIMFSNAFGSHHGLRHVLLFDILSLLNHSCSPNIAAIFTGGKMNCVTNERISKGEQLFINYIVNHRETRLVRREMLMQTWNFLCNCRMCTKEDITEEQIEKADRTSIRRIWRILDRIDQWDGQRGAYILRLRYFFSGRLSIP